MKRFASSAIVLAVALAVCASAQGAVTAYVNWNEKSDPADYSVDGGWDWINVYDGPAGAQRGAGAGPYGEVSLTESKFGAGSWDATLGGGGNNIYMFTTDAAETPSSPLNAAAGTISFWFKPGPLWDIGAPGDNVYRNLFFLSKGAGWEGLQLDFYNANLRTLYYTTAGGGAPWNYASSTAGLNPDDWNHVAMSWDAAGMYTSLNGAKIGEYIYAVGDPVFDPGDGVSNPLYPSIGGSQGFTGGGQDTLVYYDDLAFYDTAEYTGPDYTVPDSEVPEPMTLGLLSLGGLAIVRRRRR